MRIVGGKYRGRVLMAPMGHNTRPTADRVRESLFNILASDGGLDGAVVLDVFAGSGALGFEALSRGAARVTFIENDDEALAMLGANIKKLGVSEQVTLLRGDATKPAKPARQAQAPKPANLVMLDPPYRKGLVTPALLALDKLGWVAEQATIVAEVSAGEPYAAPEGFEIADERKYGAARLVFLARAAD